eukprot:183134-Chlamydomonas_euryale.AAC.1
MARRVWGLGRLAAHDKEGRLAAQGKKGLGGVDDSRYCLTVRTPSQVCLHFASKLLSGGRVLPLADLFAEWRHAVPEPLVPSLEMLAGQALVSGVGGGS